jgi:hypothetical protein
LLKKDIFLLTVTKNGKPMVLHVQEVTLLPSCSVVSVVVVFRRPSENCVLSVLIVLTAPLGLRSVLITVVLVSGETPSLVILLPGFSNRKLAIVNL